MIFAYIMVVGAVPMVLVLASGRHLSWPSVNFTLSFIGIGVLGWAYLWLWHANTRLLIGRAVVGYQDLLGRRRFWPTSDIARIVQVTIAYSSRYRAYIPQSLVLLMDSDGRCLCKVKVAAWTRDAVDSFTTAAGRTPEYLGLYKPRQAAKELPGSVGLMYAHPVWWTAIFAVIVIAVGALFDWYFVVSR
ncbi:MAG TPA: hypothetical protein DCF65_05075 [Chloroflexi bacterium]|nr:hypothetical protein [Chloroflexota bacterium]HAF18441.1 hypothetical protein [Chloroflexota bacterium]